MVVYFTSIAAAVMVETGRLWT